MLQLSFWLRSGPKCFKDGVSVCLCHLVSSRSVWGNSSLLHLPCHFWWGRLQDPRKDYRRGNGHAWLGLRPDRHVRQHNSHTHSLSHTRARHEKDHICVLYFTRSDPVLVARSAWPKRWTALWWRFPTAWLTSDRARTARLSWGSDPVLRVVWHGRVPEVEVKYKHGVTAVWWRVSTGAAQRQQHR